MSDLAHIIDAHGLLPYFIILVWTFFEGETIVLIAGFAAQDGTPWLPLVMLCAFFGSLSGDQLAFFLGRYKGKAFVARRPRLQLRAAKVYRILEKHQNWLIVGFRFMYGLRNITPFIIGMSRVKTDRFMILNFIGAAVWAVTFSCAGYFLGAAAKRLFAYETVTMVIALCIIVIVFWIVRLIVGRRARRRGELAAQTEQAGV
jgi:membrane protein DedA with SNARE-associated domain